MAAERRKSVTVMVGDVPVGGAHPVAVQTMLSARPGDIDENIRQAKEAAEAGCGIIRVAVPDMEAIELIYALKSAVPLPLVADIHFDHRLAVESASAGADKIRINPSNIGSPDRVRKVVDACRIKGIPIRVGANGGSLSKDILAKYGGPVPEAVAEQAMEQVRAIEAMDYGEIIVSVKASSVPVTVEATRITAGLCRYPLHIGVTEAGLYRDGIIKGAMGIGALLLQGIGDTIRVSLTASPREEIEAGFGILRAAGLRGGAELISCPTCGRCKYDLRSLAERVGAYLRTVGEDIKVAVMGCAVNGPGEASEADVGVAGGDGMGLLFRKGREPRRVSEEELFSELIKEIDDIIELSRN